MEHFYVHSGMVIAIKAIRMIIQAYLVDKCGKKLMDFLKKLSMIGDNIETERNCILTPQLDISLANMLHKIISNKITTTISFIVVQKT